MSDWFTENAPAPAPKVSPEDYLARAKETPQAQRPENGRPKKWELPPVPGFREPLVNLAQGTPEPTEATTWYGKLTAGAVRGMARGASGLTTPENISLMGGMKLAPHLLGRFGRSVSAGAGLYFAAEMAKALVQSLPEAKAAWQSGDTARLGEIIGEDMVLALMLGGGAKHMRREARPTLERGPTLPGPLRELPLSEAGKARLRAEKPPGPTGPVISREQRRAGVQPPTEGLPEVPTYGTESPEVARLRGIAQRLGMDFESMSAGDRQALSDIQREMNQATLANLSEAGPGIPWWPTLAEARRKATRAPGVAQEPPEGLAPIPGIPEGGTIGAEATGGRPAGEPGAVGEGPPIPRSRPPRAETWSGRETRVLIPGADYHYAAQYEVRELTDVYPSHNPFTFQKNSPDTYWYENPRNYGDPINQERIVLDSSPGRFQPERLITNNPDAVNGPPIIDAAGNAVGGNGRVMKLSRVYSGTDPKGAQGYRDMLLDQAEQFGVDPVPLLYMKEPVLVRRLTRPVENPKEALTDLNRDPQAELTAAEQAVADAKRAPIEAVEYLQRVIEDAGPETTLNEALSGPKGAGIINELVSRGVFAVQEKPKLVDVKTGGLTQAAKDRISQMMLGRFFRDSDQFQRTPGEIKAKLERVAAALAQVQGKGEWDITPRVQEALDLLEAARAVGAKSPDEFLRQQTLFGRSEWSPEAAAIARKLQENPLSVVRAFRQYAREAADALQGKMIFGTPTPADSFAAAFEPGAAARRKPAKAPGVAQEPAEGLPPIPGIPEGATIGAEATGGRPGAEPGTAAKGKEPWQMTREEFGHETLFRGVGPHNETLPNSYWSNRESLARIYGPYADSTIRVGLKRDVDINRLGAKSVDSLIAENERFGVPGLHLPAGMEIPTVAEFPAGTPDIHRAIVERALSEGKPVPPEVLGELGTAPEALRPVPGPKPKSRPRAKRLPNPR